MTATALQREDAPETAQERPYHALTAIPDIDAKILEAVGKGRSLLSIADEYGVSDVAILHRCQQYPEYKRQASIGVELRMDKREQELESAPDNVSVTRADRLLGHARWIAERLAADRFGQKPTNINIINGITVDQALDSIAGSLLDKVRTVASQEHVAVHSTADAHEPEGE